MFKKLFGTDGIRGTWGEKISPELAFSIGKAVALIFERENEKNTIIIGKDMRLSCDTLESALIAGITSMGTNVIDIGIVPTAAVPFSIAYYNVNAGLMITASHNPAEHNGFKFFNGNGFRISGEQESHIEHIIANSCDYVGVNYNKLGRVKHNTDSVKSYIKFIRKELKISKNIKICFDCANGCASEIIEEIFKGYNFRAFDNEPTGLNTNLGCGATHMEELKKIMEVGDFDMGFSFDGDADRVRIALRGGEVLSGEDIIYILTKYNKLKSVITTKMSNMALVNCLEKEGIKCVVVDIGESAVLQGLLENNAILGGENNGHYILLNKEPTSDGILISAQIASVFEKNKGLEVPFEPYAQFEKAVEIKNKNEVIKNPMLKDKINLCESLLAEKGRILIRQSGTEEVIRVLVEGEEKSLVAEVGEELVKTISSFN